MAEPVKDIRAAVAAAGKSETAAAPAPEEPKPDAAPKKPKNVRAQKAAAEMEHNGESDDDTETPELPKYRVKLQDNPELVVEAEDRLDAIEKYKELCGIIATPHKFTVAKVK